jgi:Sulfotransferase domain
MKSIESKRFLLGHVDLDAIGNQNGFEAIVDFPLALYYEQILLQYPECKFILTKRSTAEVWFQSWEKLSNSFQNAVQWWGLSLIPQVQRLILYNRWIYAFVNHDDTFLNSISSSFPAQNKDRVMQQYENHIERVRSIIPSERLLEYSVEQGWEPLCHFLEIENCPLSTSFPKTHATISMQAQAISSSMFIIILVMTILLYVIKGGKIHRKCE